MREIVIPNENYFIFVFMEIRLNDQNMSEWRRAYNYLISIVERGMFLASDGRLRVEGVCSFQEVTMWLHNFVEKH